jgi:hypothetical protein
MSNPETIRPRRTELTILIIGGVRALFRPFRRGAALRRILPLASAVAGLLVGIAVATANPRPQTSDASVLFMTQFTLAPGQGQTEREAMDSLLAVARSRPVLANAAEAIKPAVSVQALQRQVQVTIVRNGEIQISVQAATTARAQTVATAVADSYVGYADEKLPPDDTPMMLGTILSQGPSRLDYILEWAWPGAMCGGLLGAIGAIALRRRTRWSHQMP